MRKKRALLSILVGVLSLFSVTALATPVIPSTEVPKVGQGAVPSGPRHFPGYALVDPAMAPSLGKGQAAWLAANPRAKVVSRYVYLRSPGSATESTTLSGGVMINSSCSIPSPDSIQTITVSTLSTDGKVTQYLYEVDRLYYRNNATYYWPQEMKVWWTRTTSSSTITDATMRVTMQGNDWCTNSGQTNGVVTPSPFAPAWLDATTSYTYYWDSSTFSSWNPNQAQVWGYYQTSSSVWFADKLIQSGFDTRYVVTAFPG